MIGPKAGLNVTWLVGDDVESFWDLGEKRTGVAIGAFIIYKFNGYFALQPEAYYSQWGSKGGDETAGQSLRIHYVEAPILAKFFFRNRSYLTPYVVFGPAPFFRVGCNVERHEGASTQEGGCDDWVAETPLGNAPIELKNLTINVVVGVGFDLEVWGGAFGLDARYSVGLTTIDNSDFGTDMKNRGVQFLLGYAFAWEI